MKKKDRITTMRLPLELKFKGNRNMTQEQDGPATYWEPSRITGKYGHKSKGKARIKILESF
jgi:hypothetical protein